MEKQGLLIYVMAPAPLDGKHGCKLCCRGQRVTRRWRGPLPTRSLTRSGQPVVLLGASGFFGCAAVLHAPVLADVVEVGVVDLPALWLPR